MNMNMEVEKLQQKNLNELPFKFAHTELHQLIETLKLQFFQNHGGKNLLFKNKQKIQLSKWISETIDFNTLLQNSCYYTRVENNPQYFHIWLDYTLFKCFINETNIETISNHILKTIQDCINEITHTEDEDIGTTEKISIFLNLDTFTLSAAHRYKDFFIHLNRMFSNTNILPYIERFHVYNCPSAFEPIFHFLKPFLYKEILHKIVLYPLP